ncbi:MAG: glycoside hydrolase family 1 protein [Nostocoides sp.]
MRFSTGGLRIGVSTSALQIEGGDRNNNWYAWAQQPGRIGDGSSPVRATDHWNRWREDTALMADLGLQIYRMGVEWSRIEPREGEFDQAVLDRYRKELQALRDNGIEPLVTLHHFTNPLWFQEMGEWTAPRSVDLFLRFTRAVVEALGDVVSEWVTINEPNVYAAQFHLLKQGPPGTSSYRNVRKVLRHMAISHCAAYDLIHAIQPDAQVGVAHHLRVFAPLNPRHPVHRVLTRVNEHLFQTVLTDALLGGRFRSFLGPQPKGVRPGRHYDYLGINYYSRTAVSKIDDGTFPGVPVNDLGWEIHPAGIVEVARDLHARYPGRIWVTENGTCDNGVTGRVERFRSRYVHDHLAAIAGSGLPFERYYHWCFVDNWEWAEGDRARFGIVHLDSETLDRTVKPSGRFLAQVIADRGVTEAAYAAYVASETYPVG